MRLCSLVLLPSLAAASGSTVEIAPGVFMPLLNDGVSDRSVWLQAGGTGLDTAIEYGDPDQRRVGEAVRASGRPRDELFITTKVPCCPNSGSFPYGQKYCAGHPEWKDTTAAVQHNFEMLGLDYIDLLLVHWSCDTLEQNLEVWSQLEPFVDAGKIRAIGVSNFNASMLEAFVPKVAIKPAVNQVSFSIGGHWPAETATGKDDVTLAKCKELGITLAAWAPQGGVSGIDVRHDPQVAEVAEALEVSTAQVALRWLVQQGIPAVTSTSSPAHALSDLAVYGMELSEKEMALLSAVAPPGLHERVLFA